MNCIGLEEKGLPQKFYKWLEKNEYGSTYIDCPKLNMKISGNISPMYIDWYQQTITGHLIEYCLEFNLFKSRKIPSLKIINNLENFNDSLINIIKEGK